MRVPSWVRPYWRLKFLWRNDWSLMYEDCRIARIGRIRSLWIAVTGRGYMEGR